jgi:hypothetical protein
MLDVLTHILDRRRADPNSDGDHGMVVNIVSWVLLVVTVFTLLARMAMKMVYAKRGHRFGWDDVFILLAFVSPISFPHLHTLTNPALQHWTNNRGVD